MPRVQTGRHYAAGAFAPPCITGFTLTGQTAAADRLSPPANFGRMAISADGSTAYVIGISQDGLHSRLYYFDITTGTPTYISYIYLTAFGAPGGATLVGDIIRHGDWLYILSKPNSITPTQLDIVDISDPDVPVDTVCYVSDGSWGRYGHQIKEVGGFLYLFIRNVGTDGVRIFDVTGGGFSSLGTIDNGMDTEARGSDLVGNYYYTPQYDWDLWSGETWAEIWDVSDPTAMGAAVTTPHTTPPAWFDPFSDDFSVENVGVISNVLALVSHYTDWHSMGGPYRTDVMDAFDISNLASITYIGQVAETSYPINPDDSAGNAPQVAKWGSSLVQTLRNDTASPDFGLVQPYCIPPASLSLGIPESYLVGGFDTSGLFTGAPCEITSDILILAGKSVVSGDDTLTIQRYGIT